MEKMEKMLSTPINEIVSTVSAESIEQTAKLIVQLQDESSTGPLNMIAFN